MAKYHWAWWDAIERVIDAAIDFVSDLDDSTKDTVDIAPLRDAVYRLQFVTTHIQHKPLQDKPTTIIDSGIKERAN